jgi:hypothetical protein
VPGALEVGAGTSHSYSGLIDDGKAREAKAVTDIASVTLGPVVQLTGLHWEAVWNSTGEGPQLGTFTIGSAVIGGSPVPTNDPNEVIAQANQALTASQMGIQLAAPTSRQVNGVQFVDPMGIQIVPSHTRDAAAAAVLGGAQPAREQLFQALLDADCSNSAGITVADIVVGSLTGAGSLNLTVGGVQASSSEIPENPFKLGTFSLGRPGLDSPLSGGNLGGSSGRPAAQTGGAQPGAGAGATPPPAAKTVTPVAALSGKGVRGGAMAGVGLASLALLVGLAAADQRKMRRAQRDIPQFTV